MKKKLRELLDQDKTDEIAELALEKRRVFNLLVSLTFDPDLLIQWRAISALGAAAERMSQQDPDYVLDHLRRLYWLMSEESGGICWRSPEAMAEIVRHQPDLFYEYVPIVVSLLQEMAEEDLMHFRPGILWAIGRLGPIAEKELAGVLSTIIACLDHPDPNVRGMAVWCLGQCGRAELVSEREDLLEDEAPVTLFENGELDQFSIAELVRGAIESRPTL